MTRALVIYDGLCNLCVSLVQVLERIDGGLFRYVPMQDAETLAGWQITPGQCELGMILIDPGPPEQRFQGSEAAQEIGRRLGPAGDAFVSAYRALPGLSHLGDYCYIQIRDNRYDWFGKRSEVYPSPRPPAASEIEGVTPH